ncbi:MAG: UDP-2,4-diacetamido-2,4,6-trideoxy-beta-L-altropyranose hydrolase [Candidatus Electrothrix sp. GW3-4]|uniref:UDP-2,4-diacetamido-2,4, 6-trideoxy-beta-L-altropyranose hydrolase n=1 Tax=Candidatus Electrothrix sp. GW3-4 TaxID=3126740 RepID=UPI0030CDC857
MPLEIKKRYLFRVDSSIRIGTGHLMRCRTLAEELKVRGADVHFVCRRHRGNLNKLLRETFPVHELPSPPEDTQNALDEDYAGWLGVTQEQDATETIAALQGIQLDWLIVDHYGLDKSWESALCSHVGRIMVIDDLANRIHDCDLLLDQNLGRDKKHYHHLVPEKCTVLTGPRYSLLRPEFAALRDYSLQRRANPKLKHLMISMGGVDQINATGQILEAIKACTLPDNLRITVVMGPNAPWLSQIKSIAEQLPQTTEVMVNVQNMAQLMADSDLAIGAAGSTSWERCCLGLPTLTLIVAENQQESAMALEQKGCIKILDCIDVVFKQLSSTLRFFMNSTELIKMSQSSSSVVDGKGTGRVLRTFFESVKPIPDELKFDKEKSCQIKTM